MLRYPYCSRLNINCRYIVILASLYAILVFSDNEEESCRHGRRTDREEAHIPQFLRLCMTNELARSTKNVVFADPTFI